MTLETSGKVGIGTNTPSAKLTIRNEAANHQLVEISRAASDI
jgi:hypothetical protein